MIKSKQLNSSAISLVIYNDETNELSITFTSGGTYSYPSVPEAEYNGLIAAVSAGQYFHKHIKKYAKYS